MKAQVFYDKKVNDAGKLFRDPITAYNYADASILLKAKELSNKGKARQAETHIQTMFNNSLNKTT
jgi:hypothetical protein